VGVLYDAERTISIVFFVTAVFFGKVPLSEPRNAAAGPIVRRIPRKNLLTYLDKQYMSLDPRSGPPSRTRRETMLFSRVNRMGRKQSTELQEGRTNYRPASKKFQRGDGFRKNGLPAGLPSPPQRQNHMSGRGGSWFRPMISRLNRRSMRICG
jgi:hypothetical protein